MTRTPKEQKEFEKKYPTAAYCERARLAAAKDHENGGPAPCYRCGGSGTENGFAPCSVCHGTI